MIWLWIIAALILSLLPLINKKIDLSYYMWILLPIDAYGISIAGAVVKPYMIFAVVLPVVLYAKNKCNNFNLSASKGQLFLGIISSLIIAVNLLSSDSFSSVKAAIMTLVVYLCAQLYTSSADCKNSEQLSDVFIAACFGCGVVYLIAYVCLQNGLDISGIVALDRAQDGMFMQMRTMSNGSYLEVYRLRGFAYDPNTMFVQFIFGISVCTSRLFKKFNLYYVFTLIISMLCIILSSSRMGLICGVASIVITSFVSIIQSESIKKKILSFVSVLTIGIGLLVVVMSSWGQSKLSSILATYSNRSNLTDEYGRFSIWKECFAVYWEKSPFLGVGLGKMSQYTTTERMTHNTWLQFICECGLIVGCITIIYFLSIMIIGWAKTVTKYRNDPENTSYLSLVIGYTVTIISLVSADNTTCSYLWFGALLLLKMAFHLKPNDDVPKNALEPHTLS